MPHEVSDALLWLAVALAVAGSWLSGMRAGYWKRIARIHENARIEAKERAFMAERALDALRQALAPRERVECKADPSDGSA